uniref:Uncharacterized protein n=1 Tax=Amphimedon queenslandica TaxID=400682 RepID=A0A1X7T594_AMPQE
ICIMNWLSPCTMIVFNIGDYC